MYNGGRIPTPWSHRWRRMRYGLLPVVSFCVCLAVTLWLWHRQGQLPHAVGEVESVRADVAAGANGRLAALSHPCWTLFETVQENQLLGMLDDRSIAAQIATLDAGRIRLDKEVKAVAAKLVQSAADRNQVYLRESVQLTCDVEQRRLAVLEHKTRLEADEVELLRQKAQLEFMEPLFAKNIIPEKEIVGQRMLCDVIAKRIEDTEAAMKEAKTQQEAAEDRLEEFHKAAADRLPTEERLAEEQLAPVRAAIDEQLARIEEVKIARSQLEIRAPMAGTICSIQRWPGQNVRAGDPILTVAAERGRYILSYVRQDQRIRPVEGMAVEVRVRAAASQPVATTVEQVGPQIEPVPLHQCRDPKLPEWGVPVRIRIPEGFLGRPGELIDITFKGT
jgi:multidrug resistance efflux pump